MGANLTQAISANISFGNAIYSLVAAVIIIVITISIITAFIFIYGSTNRTLKRLKEAQTKGWVDLLDISKSMIKSFLNSIPGITSKWFVWLEWILIIGTVYLIGVETKNQIILIVAYLSYFMIFLDLLASFERSIMSIFHWDVFRKIVDLFEKDDRENIKMLEPFIPYIKLFDVAFFALAILWSLSITIIIYQIIIYLVSILQTVLHP